MLVTRDSKLAQQLRLFAAHGMHPRYYHQVVGINSRLDTLQAVRGHKFSYTLDRPGEQDLTAHVDFAGLAEAARRGGAKASRTVTQGTWLETLGIGARAMALAAKNPADTESISAARRRLCDEGEMGHLFKVIALTGKGWPEVAGLES